MTATPPADPKRRPDDPGLRVLVDALRRDPPGQPTDNRLLQTQSFKGVCYLALTAVASAASGATVKVVRRRGSGRPGGTGAGVGAGVRKGMSAPGTPGGESDWLPLPDGHPAARLFRSPNPNQSISDLIYFAVVQRGLTGTAPLWARPNRLGRPFELYCVPTALTAAVPVSPLYPRGGLRIAPAYPNGVLGTAYGVVGGGGPVVPGEQVHRWRNPHPLYLWDGYSPLTAGGVQLDVLNAIDDARKSAMDNGFTPDALINVLGATQQTLDRFQAALEAKHVGARKTRKVLLLDGEKADAKMLNQSPKEMDFGAGWDQMVKFCLALFGVPPAIAGVAEASSYAQLFASLKQFDTLTLRPLLRNLAQYLTVRVLEPAYGPGVAVQIDPPAVEDPTLLEQQTSADLQHGTLSYNEARALRNRGPVPGGDVPVPVYVEAQRAKVQQAMRPPQPPGVPPRTAAGGDETQPAPGAGGGPEPAPAGAARDLAPAPGSGGVPRPDNPAGAGGLPGRLVRKAARRHAARLIKSLRPAA